MKENIIEFKKFKESHILKISIILASLSLLFILINAIQNHTIFSGDLIGLSIFVISIIITLLLLLNRSYLSKLVISYILPLTVFSNVINGHYLEFNILWIPIALFGFAAISFVIYDYDKERSTIYLVGIYYLVLLFFSEIILFKIELLNDETLIELFSDNFFPIKATQLVVYIFLMFILFHLTHFNTRYQKELEDINSHLQVEQMKLIDKLSSLDSRFKIINESIDMVITDTKGFVSYANECFCRNSQYKIKELIGKNLRLLNSSHHNNKFFKNLWNTILEGNTWKGEIKNKRKDGSYYWSECVISNIYDSNKKSVGYISLMFDISKIKESESHLQKINDLNRNVVASIIHDLKTPISNIQYLIKLLANDSKIKPEDKIEIFDHIIYSCDDSTQLLEELAELTSLDTNPGTVIKEKTGLNLFILSVIEPYRKRINELKISLILELTNEKIYVNISKDKFKRVLVNLLSNAMKFTPEKGKIYIKTFLRDENTVRIEIADTGIGIPIKYQPFIFERFNKSSRSGLRGEKSTGLGLSIVKQIVELHGGKISFLSSESKGTTFFIDL